MDINKSRIIICGKGGSGKDYLKQKFVNKGYLPSVTYTTRQPREGEIDGVDYHFIDIDKCNAMIQEKSFIDHKEFNGWIYATSKQEFINSNIFIMSPPSIKDLSSELLSSSFIIYLDIDENIRRSRMDMRVGQDSTERRIKADLDLFKDFIEYDIRIDTPNF